MMQASTEEPAPVRFVIGGKRGGTLFGLAAVGTAALSFPTQILLERSLGVEGFAQWSFLNALCTILISIACLGSKNLILSEFYSGHLRTHRGLLQLMVYLSVCSGLSLVGFFGVYIWSVVTRSILLPSFPLELFALCIQIPIVLVYPVFQIREQANQIALWPLIQNMLRFGVAALSTVIAATYTKIVSIWAASSFLLAAWTVAICWRPLYRRLRNVKKSDLRSVIRQDQIAAFVKSGIGFGANDFIDSLDLKFVVPLAGLMFAAGEISTAALTVMLLNAIHFFPYVVATRLLLPAVHRLSATDPRPLYKMVMRLSLFVAGVLLPSSIVFYYFGYDVLARLLAGDYSAYQTTFKTLSLAILPVCLSILGSVPFLSKQDIPRLFRWRMESLILFFGSTLMLVRPLGVTSLIWGVVASRTYLCARFYAELARKRLTA